ncbi:MAG: response regulator [Lentisphaeraceae bacterium]|nr:response regulator [Lentisphaeraceae bacterium]
MAVGLRPSSVIRHPSSVICLPSSVIYLMNKHLLLVDDDPNIRMMLGDFLVGAGYEVTCADSGEAALQCMLEALPDLVILDMGMPGMGGTGFLERITDRLGRTRVPVLVLTARSNLAEFFANKQIAGFLTKPADPEELLAEVQRILFMESDLPRGETMVVGEDVRRLVVLAEANAIRANALCEALGKAGFTVEVVRTGPEAIEAVIARRPAGLILPMNTEGMSADGVLEILRKLPAGQSLPIVLYAAECMPERVCFIDPRNVAKVPGTDGLTIARVAMKTIV